MQYVQYIGGHTDFGRIVENRYASLAQDLFDYFRKGRFSLFRDFF
jgi:hypothetical protein